MPKRLLMVIDGRLETGKFRGRAELLNSIPGVLPVFYGPGPRRRLAETGKCRCTWTTEISSPMVGSCAGQWTKVSGTYPFGIMLKFIKMLR